MSEQDAPEIGDVLREKFPQLKPVKGNPSLFTLNGFGLSVYGRRDFDPETGTYVKTHVFCMLFMPIFALGSYRVADAEGGGWYFLGKEPMSGLAKFWNQAVFGLMLIVAAAIFWAARTSSPEYIAGQKLEEAAALAEQGMPVKAARLYGEVMQGNHFHTESLAGYEKTINSAIESGEPDIQGRAFNLLGRQHPGLRGRSGIFTNAFTQGLKLAAELGANDPSAAMDLLKQVETIVPDSDQLPSLKLTLLKQVVVKEPQNVDRGVELALVYETTEQYDEARDVLKPHRSSLGITEGARLLGQLDIGEGNYEGAFQLLKPYVDAKMAHLHKVETDYTNTVEQVYQAGIKELEEGRAPKSWYSTYDAATEEKQGEMVDEFTGEFMKKSSRYQNALRAFQDANATVDVALDLGMAQLNRAHGIESPADRKNALNDAKQTFLSIESFAGGSSQYLLFMGQVEYWLGNSAEGRQQFDTLLARSQRAIRVMMSLSGTLREVGEVNWARELAEESFEKAEEPQTKYAAASQRASMHKDVDDRIKWLERSDPESAHTVIALNGARGRQALSDNRTKDAEKFLRAAVTGYEKLPKSATSLNNKGLGYLDLFEVSGKVQDYQHGVALLNEAHELEPGESILLQNTASVTFRAAWLDLVADRFDLALLKEPPSQSMAGYLYADEESQRAIYDRLRESRHFKKATSLLDRALILSPKRIGNYSRAISNASLLRDLDALKQLGKRIETAQPDGEQGRESALSSYAGTNTTETVERLQSGLAALRKKLADPKLEANSLTHRYLQHRVSTYQQSLARMTGKPTADGLVQSARALVASDPGDDSNSILASALQLQVLQDLLAEHPRVKPLAQRTRELWETRDLLIHLLDVGGAPAEFIKKHGAMKESVALAKQRSQLYPSWPAAEDWALARHIDAGVAVKLAAALTRDEIGALTSQLLLRLAPYSSSIVLEQYRRELAAGNKQQAKTLYADAIKRGIPFPKLPN